MEISNIKSEILNDDIKISMKGIGHAIVIVDDISDVLIKKLQLSSDRLVITEKISVLFDSYLRKLGSLLDNEDPDLKFWSATLVVHYGIADTKAEKILLDEIERGELSKAYTASTILFRTRNSKLRNSILERLKDKSLDNKAKDFFMEKLEMLKEGKG